MKILFSTVFVFLFAFGVCQAQLAIGQAEPKITKIAPNAEEGFSYPYYLYVPESIRRSAGTPKKPRTVLVLPNNSGKTTDDFSVHESDVQRRIKRNAAVADKLEVVILAPVFPRPGTDWKIYTHALDRDSMTTEKKEYSRFDQQLAAMIDSAQRALAGEGLKFEKKVLMLGFSASGMFANRFAFLHPDRVKAVAVGSPGGWAIAPAAAVDGKLLRYPIGVADLKAVAGRDLDLKQLRKVPFFFFLGDGDANDSVVFRDGYEQEDEELIFTLFGKTPVERWYKSKQLYADAKLNAEFRLYSNVQHTISKEMFDDILKFFNGVL